MGKKSILQIDLCKIDGNRVVPKVRSNGDDARFYNIVIDVEENEDEKGNIGVAYEKLTKAEYDAGSIGRKIGYIQRIKKHS